MISQGPSICVFNKEDPQEVLASWLFTQFLLTNEVQVAYAQTEGYVPVTRKAQETQGYREYLSRIGEDNDTYYEVKIKATRLVLDNEKNTFVTPVFNGSTSLRNAAGQMIENTAKSTRRKEEINEEYMEKLYKDVESLYHLDQINVDTNVQQNLGPLPKEAKLLLGGFVVVWLCIGLSFLNYLCKSNKSKRLKL